jgi:AcrR family transcriptional regulator
METPVPTSTRVTKRDETLGRRQEIVAIAMDLFAQKGVQATSVREIAAQAGILSGSLYSHFESKAEILDLGLRPYTEIYLQVIRGIVEKDAAPKDKIYELLRQSFRLMQEWRAATVVTNSDWEYISSLERFAFLRGFYSGVEGLYLQALREAIDSGALAPDVDPKTVQRLLGYIILGVARQYHADSKFDIDLMTNYVHRMLFGGLSTPRTGY